jgi:hypothetical protein
MSHRVKDPGGRPRNEVLTVNFPSDDECGGHATERTFAAGIVGVVLQRTVV